MSRKDKKNRRKNEIAFNLKREYIMKAMVENYDIMRRTTVSMCEQVSELRKMFKAEDENAMAALDLLADTCDNIMKGVSDVEQRRAETKELEVGTENPTMENESEEESL